MDNIGSIKELKERINKVSAELYDLKYDLIKLKNQITKDIFPYYREFIEVEFLKDCTGKSRYYSDIQFKKGQKLIIYVHYSTLMHPYNKVKLHISHISGPKTKLFTDIYSNQIKVLKRVQQ